MDPDDETNRKRTGVKEISLTDFIFFSVGSIFLFLLLPDPALASRLKTNETVLFFKVDAYQKTHTENSTWFVPLHAWVYEAENDSFWRKKLIEEIADEIDLDDKSPEYQNLQYALKMFLVDSQSFKRLNVSIDNQAFSIGPSGFNGHIYNTLKLDMSARNNEALLDIRVNESALENKKKIRESVIRLIPKQGISIISDIDDTIKDSHVLDKKELIKNTFLRPAKPVASMKSWYQCIFKHFSNKDSSRAYFHYISASPWQLYPMLDSFLREYDFPEGSLYLRTFRIKDRSLLNFLKPSTDYKISTISHLIERFPNRDFILIGDSGEHDPEIYADILRKFPARVKMIYIRKVPGSDLSAQRFNKAFNHIKTERWALFDEHRIAEISIVNGPDDTSGWSDKHCLVPQN